jgi:hypothetical protein
VVVVADLVAVHKQQHQHQQQREQQRQREHCNWDKTIQEVGKASDNPIPEAEKAIGNSIQGEVTVDGNSSPSWAIEADYQTTPARR